MDFVQIALAELESGATDSGVCLSCGEVASCVEPDASGYKCPSCGDHNVTGCEEVLFTVGGA